MAEIATKVIRSSDQENGGISKKTYFIKDYQRGYRWIGPQITKLLDDIYNFEPINNQKYCLQPLIVKKTETTNGNIDLFDVLRDMQNIVFLDETLNYNVDNSDIYEVIDGQQRLTTLLLIYCVCCENLLNKPNLPYKIEYQYLRNIDKQFIFNAIYNIRVWFDQFGDLIDDVKKDIREKIDSKVMFIWYEIDENENSNDIFSKVNEGKIPLTSADLFKARLLNSLEKDKSILISKEWDDIERSFANDDFWYFIANEKCDLSERMDYLLRIYVNIDAKNKNLLLDDSYLTFNYIEDKIGKDKDNKELVKEIWEEVIQIYETLLYWYNDKKLYYYIGFLVKCNEYNNTNKTTFELLGDLVKNTKELVKQQVERADIEKTEDSEKTKEGYVFGKIKNEFKNIDLDSINYYNGKEVRKILLYFNIKSIIKSEPDAKFSFKNFKKNEWDIEHIHAKATDDYLQGIVDIDKRKNLLLEIKEMYNELDNNEKVEEVENCINSLDEKNIKESFVMKYNNLLSGNVISDVDRIGNLALLDGGTNRAYKNELFTNKRKMIVEKDKNGQFIPICTRNVFLKYYSTKVKNNLIWSDEDAEEYEEEIRKMFEEDGLCQK